jgi:hypothetical protein
MKLIIKFTDTSNSFTAGVEYGRLLERFEKGIEVIDNNGFPIHLSNKDVIILTCNYFGYAPIFGDNYYNEWIDFKAIKLNNLN